MILSAEETEDFLLQGIYNCSARGGPAGWERRGGRWMGQDWGPPHTAPLVQGLHFGHHHSQPSAGPRGTHPAENAATQGKIRLLPDQTWRAWKALPWVRALGPIRYSLT